MTGLYTPKNKTRFINPPNLLKQKVGSGGLNQKLIEQAQNVIEDVKVDFLPYAKKFLQTFEEAIKTARQNPENFEEFKDEIIRPVMELKANGGMFRYELVSHVADIALQFLEAINQMNDDTHKVLIAHQNTLNVIIKNKLEGSGGQEGRALVSELERACTRYFEKYKPAKDEKKPKKPRPKK